jgi:hypothetical protein
MIGAEELANISRYQMLSADKKLKNSLSEHEARKKVVADMRP